jgi:hypothetical protein
MDNYHIESEEIFNIKRYFQIYIKKLWLVLFSVFSNFFGKISENIRNLAHCCGKFDSRLKADWQKADQY